MSSAVDARGRCETCGFDPNQLAPADAAVAVRSLARRWRELLDGVAGREEDGEMLLRRRFDSGWSPLERAGHVAGAFEHIAEAMLRVWEHERPGIDALDSGNLGRGLAVATERGDLLARLGGAAERLARVIERYDGTEWDRTGLRTGEAVTAWELVTEAIHEASHHLRGCHDELVEVCDRPLDGEEEA